MMCVPETQRSDRIVLIFTEPIRVYDDNGNLVGNYREIEVTLNQAISILDRLIYIVPEFLKRRVVE